jgi:hypothetical protein
MIAESVSVLGADRNADIGWADRLPGRDDAVPLAVLTLNRPHGQRVSSSAAVRCDTMSHVLSSFVDGRFDAMSKT